MDLELLKTFLEVASTRHFGKAAEHLCITQAAVSSRIKTLEKQLNTQLFIRDTKNVQLTGDGARFAMHAQSMMHMWHQAKLEIGRNREQKEQITIGASPGLWRYQLTQKLDDYLCKHPVMLNALSFTGADLVEALCTGRLDVAIGYDQPNDPSLHVKQLGKLDLRAVSSTQISTEEAVYNLPFIYVEWGSAFSSFLAKTFKDKLSVFLKTDIAQIAEHWLYTKPAFSYLPESSLHLNSGFHEIDHQICPAFKRKVYISYAANSSKLDYIQALIKSLDN